MEIKILSRTAMEAALKHEVFNNTAIISFYDPPSSARRGYTPLVPIDFSSSHARVFLVAAHDLDIEALSLYSLTKDTYLPEAKALATFIKRAVRDGLSLVCQCEYGQSRSAACAAAILQYYENRGIDIFADYRYYPNQLVYHKIFDALKE